MKYLPLVVNCLLIAVLAACKGGTGSTGTDTVSSAAASGASQAGEDRSPSSSSRLASQSASHSATNPGNDSSLASAGSSQSAASDSYRERIEGPIVQARCVECHVSGGLSGHTRLVFHAGAAQAAANRGVFEQFVAAIEDGSTVILNKVRGGAGHGGGSQLHASDTGYGDLASFLGELDGDSATPHPPEHFYRALTMEKPEQTLRRAALLLAGRLPSPAELSLAQGGDQGLREAVRSLMQGEAFHRFLLRGANDRLLTDAFIEGRFLEVADSNNPRYPHLADARYEAYSAGDAAIDEFNRWQRGLRYGIARAPLELIAHVVENDRPYTEILTADYTLVNPQSNAVYNAGADFATPDPTQFKVGQNRGQILLDEHYEGEFVQGLGSLVRSHGPFVDYPHAGVLNEPAFLNRYPTTDTNRNRARARWTYYHFLGLDIEKSAARTTDPEALADTDNPTMNNPNCTVCHRIMDPVAGGFQNYGNEGWYRSSWGGRDALPDAYKYRADTPYRPGDTWFRDMRRPGFGNTPAPDADRSLQWLARRIVADTRFARATVKFWWPAIMSEDLLAAPENSDDPDFDARLRAYEAQNALIEQLATGFREGFAGGRPYNLKDLLAAMVTSDWFRASSSAYALDSADQVALQSVGKGRLLTPEELEQKTGALLGFIWGERRADWVADGTWTRLADQYRIYYGGIDSDGIVDRARSLNSLMSNVALAHALSVSCPAVIFEFNRDANDKRLFTEIDRYTTPTLQAREAFSVLSSDSLAPDRAALNPRAVAAGEYRVRLAFTNPYWDAELEQSSLLVIHRLSVRTSTGEVLFDIDGQNLSDHDAIRVSHNNEGNPTGNRFWDSELTQHTGFVLWSGHLELALSLAAEQTLAITVEASRRNLPEQAVTLGISVDTVDPHGGSAGEWRIRRQLQQLFATLLGETAAIDGPSVDEAYELLVTLWEERRARGFPPNAIAWDHERCEIPVDGWWDSDRSRELADPNHMQGTWIALMIYFLTDYHYLHE